MVICAAVGCSNRTDRDNEFSFFRFPGIKANCGLALQDLQRERRRLWIQRINRREFGDTQAKYSRICSKHFISGKPSSLQDKNNPDWAPTLNLGYKDGKIHAAIATYYKQMNEKQLTAQRDVGSVTQGKIKNLANANLGELQLDPFENEEKNVLKKENEPETILPDLQIVRASVNKVFISDEPVTSNTTIIKEEVDSDDDRISCTSKSYIKSEEETVLPQHKEEAVQKTVLINCSNTPQTVSANYYIVVPPSSTLIIQGCSESIIQSSSTDQTVLKNHVLPSALPANPLPGDPLPINPLSNNLLHGNLLPDKRLILPTPLDPNSVAVQNSIITQKAEIPVTTTLVNKCTSKIPVTATQVHKDTSAAAIQVNLNDTEALQDGKIMYCSAECSKKIKKMKKLQQHRRALYYMSKVQS